LQEQDKNAKAGLAELERDAEVKGLSKEEGRKTFYRFRVFYLAVAEFFGLNSGEEYVVRLCSSRNFSPGRFRWGVGHYLFKAK
jgi:hypothetical protein